jgi:hypothetical protein
MNALCDRGIGAAASIYVAHAGVRSAELMLPKGPFSSCKHCRSTFREVKCQRFQHVKFFRLYYFCITLQASVNQATRLSVVSVDYFGCLYCVFGLRNLYI